MFSKATPHKVVPRTAVYAAGAMAGIAMAGWVLHLHVLTSVLPGHVSMKANTAIAFLLLVGALQCAALRRNFRWQQGLALGAMLLGFLTLLEYALGINFGMDEVLFRDPIRSLFPGRMAPITATNFFLLGAAMLLPTFKWSDHVKESLALVVALTSTFAIVGYLYGVPALYGAVSSSSYAMALHTGVNFLLLAIGFLFVERETGFVRVFHGSSIASMVARYLVPIAFLVPVVLGAIFIRTRWSLGHPHLVMALTVVSNIVLLVGLIWLLASMIQRIEAERAAVQQQAETDKLTGIYNRRHFEDSLELEIQRARRYGAPLALLMIDVDNFKLLNDRHGHLMGDRMLCRLARECESCLRISDVFCRYGGDEFVIIAPETSAQAAMTMARRMRQNIEAVGTDQSFGALGISIGIAVWEDNFKTNDDFIAAADSALYQAKSAGRNRECLYTPKSLLADMNADPFAS
ncbi:MAG: GGDEF domain-containing protein [Acidobacteriia bacterium]|nr:GGDEF domain-containing protein [Terriglobia bacterium]